MCCFFFFCIIINAIIISLIFHTSISWWFSLESEWQQVSSSFQDSSYILADLNNDLVWMVSSRPLISKSSIPFDEACQL